MTAVVPAKNEEATVGSVVRAVKAASSVSAVVVVDNGSTDDTARVALEAGAIVVSEPNAGLGRAVKRGLAEVRTEFVIKTDADITNWETRWVDRLHQTMQSGVARAVFDSPYDDFPVTRLVVRPHLEIFTPKLSSLKTPISGTYTFRLDDFSWRELPDDWSWDIAFLVQAHERRLTIADCDIGILADRPRDLSHYEPMARDILRFFLGKYTALRAGAHAGPT